MLRRVFLRTIRLLVFVVLLTNLTGRPAALAEPSSYALFFPDMLINNPNYRSDMQLMNLGFADAMVNIELQGPAGTATYSGIIPMGGALLVTEENFPGVSGGISPFRAAISSSQPLDGVIAYVQKTGHPGLAGLVRGATSGATRLYFGPVWDYSYLTLLNLGSANATVMVNLYQPSGLIAVTLPTVTIPAQGYASVNLHLPATPAGMYLAVVDSSQPLAGTSRENKLLSWGSQARFHGPLQAGSVGQLARVVKAVNDIGGERTSSVFTANLGAATGTFTRTLYSQNGTSAGSSSVTLPVQGFQVEDLTSTAGLANGTYALSASGTDVAVADMTEYTASPLDNTSFASYTIDPGVQINLPRLVKNSGKGSVIHLYNALGSAADATISLRANGGGTYTITTTVPSSGWASVDLRGQATLPATFAGAAVVTASQPVAALVDEFYAPPCIAPEVSVSHTPSGTIYPTTLVEFTATATGNTPITYAWTVDGQPVGTDNNVYSATLAEGAHTVAIDATNTCGSDSASEMVTVSPPPCDAPTVSLSHTPGGTLYPSDTVHFTAAATGTGPLHYAWTVDGAAAGTDSPTFDTTLPANSHDVRVTVTNGCGSASDLESVFVSCQSPTMTMSQSPVGVIYPNDVIHFTTAISGTAPFTYEWSVDGRAQTGSGPTFDKALPAGDHYVTAAVTNACGAYSYTRQFTVVAPALPKADLSGSTLNASTAGATAGDRIQYIAVLRNTGTLASPGSRFTNQIPGYTQYIPSSARASDGSPVNFDGTGLTWTGDLLPGSPVVITYEVTVSSSPPDNQIHNTNAYLYDHLDVKTTLTDVVRYVPGYTFQINDGAVGTNNLTVNLSFTYNLGDNLVEYQISNNETFDGDGTPTTWLVLNGKKVHTNWKLKIFGDPRQPRKVFIRYHTSGGAIIGPFMASILYDEQAPADPKVEKDKSGALPGPSMAGAAYTVTTSDDNSGVAVLQLSYQPDFSSIAGEIPVTGQVTSFNWTPTQSGQVYIRAVDRSGNASKGIEFGNMWVVFLPGLAK